MTSVLLGPLLDETRLRSHESGQSAMSRVLTTDHLSKTYPNGVRALHDVSLRMYSMSPARYHAQALGPELRIAHEVSVNTPR